MIPIVIKFDDFIPILRECLADGYPEAFDFLCESYDLADCGMVLRGWSEETGRMQ